MSRRHTKAERLQEHEQRAVNVQPLLDNPYIQQFFADYESILIDQIAMTKTSQQDERDDAISRLRAMREFKEFLTRAVAAGRSAAEQLKGMSDG